MPFIPTQTSQNPTTLPLLTSSELLSDLAILKSNPTLLDRFLPPPLTSSSSPSNIAKNTLTSPQDYSLTHSTPQQSLSLSYDFTRIGKEVLEIKEARGGEGVEGVMIEMEERLEGVRKGAEELEGRLATAMKA